jgi:hypothetical protein
MNGRVAVVLTREPALALDACSAMSKATVASQLAEGGCILERWVRDRNS